MTTAFPRIRPTLLIPAEPYDGAVRYRFGEQPETQAGG